MYFDSADQYATEIALVQASIRRTLESQKYGMNRGGTASESQRVTLVELRGYLRELIAERDVLTATASSGACGRTFAKNGRRG